MPVKLVFGGKLTQSDPKDFPVVIIGQLPHITSITFDDVKTKLAPRVDKEVCNTIFKKKESTFMMPITYVYMLFFSPQVCQYLFLFVTEILIY